MGCGGGGDLRGGTGDAERPEAPRHPRPGHHPAQPRDRAFRRPHPRDQRPGPSLPGDRAGLCLRPRDRVPAGQHRPDRRDGRGDRGEVAGDGRPGRGAPAGLGDDLPDGGAVQHDPLPADEGRGEAGGAGGGLGDEAALGGPRVPGVRTPRLHRHQHHHRGARPGPGEVRLPGRPVLRRRPPLDRRRQLRPHQRGPLPEPARLRPVRRSPPRGPPARLPGPHPKARRAVHPRVHPRPEAGPGGHRPLHPEVRDGSAPVLRHPPRHAARGRPPRGDGRDNRVTRDALLQIDRLLRVFFKPEHTVGRYV